MDSNHSIASHPVILFDGVCNLCNASVQFVLKRDKKQQFLFASLQSAYAKKVLPHHLTEAKNLQSLVLLEEKDIKTKSSGALHIAKKLSGLWPLLYALIVIPRPVRDWVYSQIAQNRYKWFGKRDTCSLPDPGVKNRFLD